MSSSTQLDKTKTGRRGTLVDNKMTNPASKATQQNAANNQDEEAEESDNDMVSIQSDRVHACKSPDCKRKEKSHVHTIVSRLSRI